MGFSGRRYKGEEGEKEEEEANEDPGACPQSLC